MISLPNRLTNHRAVSYNKKLLVKNYDSMKALFESEYPLNFRRWGNIFWNILKQ